MLGYLIHQDRLLIPYGQPCNSQARVELFHLSLRFIRHQFLLVVVIEQRRLDLLFIVGIRQITSQHAPTDVFRKQIGLSSGTNRPSPRREDFYI